MPDRRYRILIVCSHPVQYASPLFRQMALEPRLDIKVAYCSLHGAERALDPEFGVEVKWDIPLLDGYPWELVPNRSLRPGLGRFFGLFNPGMWKLIRSGNYDAVFSYTGYACLTFWIVAVGAKLGGIPLLASADAYNVEGANPKRWKSFLKRICLPFIYRLYDVVAAPSGATMQFVESLGVPRERVVFTPGGFDSDWWAREADRADRSETRSRLGIPAKSTVVLFCAKLQPRKRPGDVLRAFARIGCANCFLVFAGEGPLREELQNEANALGISERVIFCGFVNQTGLPALYRAADLFVLPSDWDGVPLVVCEAMSCGCPVVLSDAIPGRFELVRHGKTGFVYPCGNVDALASILGQALQDPEQLEKLSTSAVKQMKAWSVPVYVDGIIQAVGQSFRLQGLAAMEPAA